MSSKALVNPFFAPTQISGCQIWLDAADPNGNGLKPSYGSSVTTWVDKSGSGLNATTVGSAPTYQLNNGYPSVDFNNQSLATGTIPSDKLDTTGITYFVVVTLIDLVTLSPQIVFTTFSPEKTIRYDQLYCSYTINNGVIRGLQNNYSNGIRSFVDTASSFNAYVNGTNAFSSSTTVTYQPQTTATYYKLGNWSSGSYYFRGYINEVLVYNFALSTAQRQQVEGYLAWKWGLQSSLPANHPYKNSPIPPLLNPPTSIPSLITNTLFLPTQISGCQLWLDGADPFGNGSKPANGATISTWVDKSGSQYNFTANSTGLTYASNAVLFVDNNYMSNSSINTFQNANTLFLVLKATGINASGIGMIFTYGSDATTDSYGYRILAPGIGTSTSYSWDVNPPGNGGNIDYAGNATLYVNGVSGTSNAYSIYNQSILSAPGKGAIVAGYPTISGLTLSRSASSRYYNGYNYETILYNSQLTTTQRQQVEGYLAWKWGLQGSLPATHPFKNSPIPPLLNPPTANPSLTFTTWQPNQISGLSLWLDGADPATITLSGTNVTQWRDKSGNGYSASPTTATKTSSNSIVIGNNGLSFANYSWRSRYTAFFVSKGGVYAIVTYRPAQNYLIYVYTPNWSLSVIYPPSGGGIEMNDSAIAQGTSVVDVNAVSILTIGYNNGSTATPYAINGTARTTTRIAGATANDGYLVGSLVFNNLTSTEFFEVIFYNDNLSTAQYQQVEGYLAWKWGLQNSLPASHPYAKWPPSP